MTEYYPSDHDLLTLVDDEETGVQYIETGKAPYYLEFRKMLYRLLLACRRANDLRVYDEGGLSIGVKKGTIQTANGFVEVAAETGITLTDNMTHYIYLADDGSILISTVGYPIDGDYQIRLARVVTDGGRITGILDDREGHMWSSQFESISPLNCSSEETINGRVPFILKEELSNGETLLVHDQNAPFAFQIIDGWSVNLGSSGGGWHIDDGTHSITDNITLSTTVNAVHRVGEVSGLYHEILRGGTVRIVGDGSNANCYVYLLCVRI